MSDVNALPAVIEVVQELFTDSVITASTKPIEELAFDSLDAVELVMELEEWFDICIPDEFMDEVFIENFTVEDVAKALNEYI